MYTVSFNENQQLLGSLLQSGIWANWHCSSFGQTSAGHHEKISCHIVPASQAKGVRLNREMTVEEVGHIDLPTPCESDPERVTSLRVFEVAAEGSNISLVVEHGPYVHDKREREALFREWLTKNIETTKYDRNNLSYQTYLLRGK